MEKKTSEWGGVEPKIFSLFLRSGMRSSVRILCPVFLPLFQPVGDNLVDLAGLPRQVVLVYLTIGEIDQI